MLTRGLFTTGIVIGAALLLWPVYPSSLLWAASPRCDVCDASYLWPIPENRQQLGQLATLADELSGGAGPLLPRDAFDNVLATAQNLILTDSAGRPVQIRFRKFRQAFEQPSAWRIVAFRVDPCAPGCDPAITAIFGSTPQIRLIAQPVTIDGDSFLIHDVTMHIVFSFVKGQDVPAIPLGPPRALPDRAAFGVVCQDLLALKRAAGVAGVSTNGPLGVHPALAQRLSGFDERVHAFLKKHLHPDRLTAVAFMGLDPPEPWIFFALAKQPNGRLEVVKHPSLGGAQGQLLTFRGGEAVVPLPVNANLKPGLGVSTAALFDPDSFTTLDRPAVLGQERPLLREIPDVIADPRQSHFFNTDCVSCHTESARRRELKLDNPFAFRAATSVSGVDSSLLPQSKWNVRNFGWFPLGTPVPTVSERTAHEAAESVEMINRDYLRLDLAVANSPDSADVPSPEGVPAMSEPVANPLTLVMRIKSADDFDRLKQKLEAMQAAPAEANPIVQALNRLGTVHFARFVFLGDDRLAVITTFDGSFDAYIDAFTDEIGPVFDELLQHIADAPPLPVGDHRNEFLAFVQAHDLKCVPPFYSAYPKLKALDILTLERRARETHSQSEPRRDSAVPSQEPM